MIAIFELTEVYNLFCIKCAKLDKSLPIIWLGSYEDMSKSTLKNLSVEERILFEFKLQCVSMLYLNSYRQLFSNMDWEEKKHIRQELTNHIYDEMKEYVKPTR